jgi:DHA1 family multidrug resistance protein-like MFS transporter
VAGAVILTLMGFVQNVEQLVALRAAQGALSGYIAASNALVAATIPREHAGESFGYLRTGNWVGTGLGPLLGGLVAWLLGYRPSFWFTGVLLAVAGVLVIVYIREPLAGKQAQAKRSFLASYRVILTTPGLRRIFSMSFVDNLGRAMILPVLPLFMMALMGGPAGVAMATGVLLGARAFAGSMASMWVGRLGDRIGHGRVVLYGALGMALLYLPQPFVTESWQLITLQVLTGLASVGIIPGIGALVSLYVPEGSAGAGFGLESSVASLARVVGPMIGAGLATLLGMRQVFAVVAAAFLFVILLALPLVRVVAAPTDGNIPT